jgi:broad specificity phosphatase PhoE
MVFLMRHAEADTNGKRFVGQWDVPLTPRGVAQAREWAERLSAVAFTAVFSSDLKRAADTAAILAGARTVEAVATLREIRLGRWEGRLMSDVRRRNPQAWEERGRRIDVFRPPGGESFADLRNRVVPAFEHLIDHVSEPVLIVSHAGVNRVLLCHLLGMPLAHLFRLGQDVAALNLIDRKEGKPVVAALNLSPFRPEEACG